ncbi:ABC transporter ATP-binding protein [Phyllobacterium zundukense]|uniref:ABC transporter ATP-binding protein n=1 Tax=Phyllobacterium zundukense TaxID=1867719 RepID=A0A2N9VR61_9HYPH|nr:ABC transporter ATP-binding protein [Phyllobacterium zundukense]ATU92411.1 ABC transporter ATP-binding protein [Phyllobacterium zundukense]PIO41979.1 ABC transporter ATP-binding protein [Phyllobacterium zundukense]
MTEPYLRVRNLTVDYGGGAALQDVSLQLAKGGRLALIGESGSGKSTFAMAIAGLLPRRARSSGAIEFPGLSHRPRLGKDIGVLFQDPSGSLDPVMKIGDQIAEVAMTHQGLGWISARVRAAELLDRVRIPRPLARLNSYPHEFSGGQKQRIALAAALAGNPSLLIADEPTSALDTVVQRHIVNLLDELVRDNGLTLLFVTHDIALASERADKIAVLYKGKLVESGPVAKVLGKPEHPYTKALIGTHISLDTPRAKRLAEINTDDLR